MLASMTTPSTNPDPTDEANEAKEANEDQKSDPRIREPEGDEGFPGPLIDTPQNLPGDQPIDDTPPSRTKATGDS